MAHALRLECPSCLDASWTVRYAISQRSLSSACDCKEAHILLAQPTNDSKAAIHFGWLLYASIALSLTRERPRFVERRLHAVRQSTSGTAVHDEHHNRGCLGVRHDRRSSAQLRSQCEAELVLASAAACGAKGRDVGIWLGYSGAIVRS